MQQQTPHDGQKPSAEVDSPAGNVQFDMESNGHDISEEENMVRIFTLPSFCHKTL